MIGNNLLVFCAGCFGPADRPARRSVYPRARLVETGLVLVDDYRRHLDWEEAHFFPALRGYLLPEDWQEIAPLFADASDPLTQNPIDQRYRMLFSALNEL